MLVAVAATSGDFLLPPVQASSVDQPEVSGFSAGGVVNVCPDAFCAPEFEDDAQMGQACPGDCSRAGRCDVATGACICRPGFSGEECEEFGSEA